jgi:transcriptional regulator with XRE-family HTH domain
MSETIHDRLAQCRRLLSVVLGRDIPQDEMAVLSGFSAGVWSHWEKGHKNPSEGTLEAIAAVMQRHGMHYITVPWLRYGIGDGPPVLGVAPEPAKTRVTARAAKPAQRLGKQGRAKGNGRAS